MSTQSNITSTIKSHTTYGVSIVMIVLMAIYLGIAALSYNKLVSGCVPSDSMLGRINISMFGVAIGFVVGILIMLIKKFLCMENLPGVSIALVLVIIAIILMTIGAISMSVVKSPDSKSANSSDSSDSSDSKSADSPDSKSADSSDSPDSKSVGTNNIDRTIYNHSITYVGIACGLLYAAIIAFMVHNQKIRNNFISGPINVLFGSLLLPAIFVMVIGTMTIIKYKKSFPNGKWKSHPSCSAYGANIEDKDIAAATQDIANAATKNGGEFDKLAPYNVTLTLTIGSGLVVLACGLIPLIRNMIRRRS